MKQYILPLLILFLIVDFSFGQTTATDFMTNDCDGVSHHLFEELDNGDVIVICWVMPCGPCATYAVYASNAVQSFSATHPNRVKYYLADDYANDACAVIDGWASNYNLITDAIFSSTDLNMLDYGQTGMPKVVVLGKNNYNIYYNRNDAQIDQFAIESAISLALSESPVSVANYDASIKIDLLPNPASEFLNVIYTLETHQSVNFEIINMMGQVVFSEKVLKDFGNHLTSLNVSDLDNGYYFLNFTNDISTATLRFVIID